ncbi:FecR family protein [Bacteroides helcogenes]|nr:FecR family protein [Bacteroides helcogenes]MDY5237085.1 FecR family protein [Bacteroides helcogenes]
MDKEILYRFFEGNASLEEGEQIWAWVEESPQNEKEFFKERKLFDAMILLTRKKKGMLHIQWNSVKNELLKIAGVVLLTLSVSYLYQQYELSTETPAMQTIYVPAGQRMNITLPDGTNVWLNARTTIQYPLAFNRKSRQVKLDGQAYFDVTKNPEKPFIVRTRKYDVEVVGTKFDVEAYSDKNQFETALMQGSVKLVSVENPKETLMLEPDCKAVLENGELKVKPLDNYNVYRWKEGLLCFTNETFDVIVRDFEKYFEVKIEVSNKEVSKYYYTGKFRQADGIDYALRVLQRDIRFTYTRDDENRIIYIK